MSDRDLIGARGEWLTQLAFTEPVGDRETLFRPQFLGDKYPTIDLIVELVDAGPSLTPFFFAQVKATTQGYTLEGNLRVQVTAAGLRSLVAYPVPTYIVGVDTVHPGRVFICAALASGPDHFPSFPTRYELNTAVLRALYDEVIDFWRAYPAPFVVSRFRQPPEEGQP